MRNHLESTIDAVRREHLHEGIAMKKCKKNANPYSRAMLIEIIEKQLQAGTPKETWATLERLMSKGYTRQEAIVKMARALADEIQGIMMHGEQYNEASYVCRLEILI